MYHRAKKEGVQMSDTEVFNKTATLHRAYFSPTKKTTCVITNHLYLRNKRY